MAENQFDAFFKNKLKDHSSEVPGNMWQKILEKKDKDRRRFIFWRRRLLILSLILCSSIAAYMILSRVPEQNNMKQDRQAKISPAGNLMDGSAKQFKPADSILRGRKSSDAEKIAKGMKTDNQLNISRRAAIEERLQ
ncbi:MAG TPA: hypothetical protein VK543_01745, partial [Puia sp.]|nr:hypothetical protein [Puia sp.]